jgi:G protein beta subunit-like protein
MSVVLATAGFDHKIRFWEAPSGICSRTISFPDSQVNRLEITPDKQFIAAAGNPVIRLYEIAAPKLNSNNNDQQQQQEAVLTLQGHTANVTALGFQREGRYLYSGSEDGTVKLWDLRSPNYSRSFDCAGAGAGVNSVCLRSDRDEIISGDQQGSVKLWDLGGNGCIHAMQPSMHSGGTDTSASHASVSSSRHRGPRLSDCAVPIQAVDISEDSRTLVAITNHGTVFVWDPSALNSSYMSSSADKTNNGTANTTKNEAKEHNTNSLRHITKFRAHAPGYYCLQGKISPDCRTLVTTGSDGLAKLWDTTTWELTETLENSKYVWDAAFCADSSYLVTASSDHVARLWNLKTGEVVRKYHGHQSSVTCVALNDSSV